MTDEERAQKIAHLHSSRCSGGMGYSYGGEVVRFHSVACSNLKAAILSLIGEVRAQEREACAKIADDKAREHAKWGQYSLVACANDIAAAILNQDAKGTPS